MQFTTRKRRQPPAIIIISLIDILIVLLIFLMVTTTFTQRPAIRLTLPESKQAKPGASEDNLVITIAKDAPHFFFKALPVTIERLQQQLVAEATAHPGIRVIIEADKDTALDNAIKAMDAATAAKLDRVTLSTKAASSKALENR
jgi:biopolymer transport protein ExbD